LSKYGEFRNFSSKSSDFGAFFEPNKSFVPYGTGFFWSPLCEILKKDKNRSPIFPFLSAEIMPIK
jgi:hypothetical protein